MLADATRIWAADRSVGKERKSRRGVKHARLVGTRSRSCTLARAVRLGPGEKDQREYAIAALQMYSAEDREVAGMAEVSTGEGETAQCVRSASKETEDRLENFQGELTGMSIHADELRMPHLTASPMSVAANRGGLG